jgi:hypothetical protein
MWATFYLKKETFARFELYIVYYLKKRNTADCDLMVIKVVNTIGHYIYLFL